MGHDDLGKPFSIPQIKSFIPERLKPWLVILFVLVVQCSGGVYLAAASEMVGSTQLLQEDIMMAGYSSLVGMALFFVIMFRLRLAVKPKTAMSWCVAVIIVANLICMHTQSVPLLVAVSMVAGFFRMWATLECNSTIQLWLTPKRDLSVFFCYVYIVVNGMIQLSGVATIAFSVWSSWHYMHWFVVGLLLLVWIAVRVCYNELRVMPRLPLLGVDWVGMLLWGGVALCTLFVCIYGEHYDWWSSSNILFATLFGVLMLALNLWRATFIRHPYIMLKTLSYPIVPISIVLIIMADILLAPSHIFEHILMEGVLGYDALNIMSLNWIALLGVVCGSIFTWRTFAVRKWTYQRMLVIAFSMMALYLAYFYFRIDYNLPKEALMFPIFIRSFGYVVIAITLLTSLTRLPFPHHFTQGVSAHNMFSAALAGPIGTAIVGRMLSVIVARKAMLLSEGVDTINSSPTQIGELYGVVQLQALMESMKEIYGILLMLSIVILLALSVRHSTIQPRKVVEPTLRAIAKVLRRDFRRQSNFEYRG